MIRRYSRIIGRRALLRLTIITFCLASGCANAQSPKPNENTVSAGKPEAVASEKILIVYLSRTRNTKAIAEVIQKNVGGDLVSLELEKPYPENYQATG